MENDIFEVIKEFLKENPIRDVADEQNEEFDLQTAFERLLQCLIESLEDDLNYGFNVEGFKVKADLLLGILGWGKKSNT